MSGVKWDVCGLVFLASRAVLATLNTQLSCILNPQLGQIMTVWTQSIGLVTVILINQRHFWNRNSNFKHSAKCGSVSLSLWEQCQSFFSNIIETLPFIFQADILPKGLWSDLIGELGCQSLSQKFQHQIEQVKMQIPRRLNTFRKLSTRLLPTITRKIKRKQETR